MNLVLGCTTIVLCMAIQCYVVSQLLRGVQVLQKKGLISLKPLPASTLLIAALLFLLVGNFIQISLWSGLFLACGEFDNFQSAFYHSVVNFSTLGYGDLVMSPERRLLGALEATNGILMLGLSTSVLFSVVSAMMRLSVKKKEGHDETAV